MTPGAGSLRAGPSRVRTSTYLRGGTTGGASLKKRRGIGPASEAMPATSPGEEDER